MKRITPDTSTEKLRRMVATQYRAEYGVTPRPDIFDTFIPPERGFNCQTVQDMVTKPSALAVLISTDNMNPVIAKQLTLLRTTLDKNGISYAPAPGTPACIRSQLSLDSSIKSLHALHPGQKKIDSLPLHTLYNVLEHEYGCKKVRDVVALGEAQNAPALDRFKRRLKEFMSYKKFACAYNQLVDLLTDAGIAHDLQPVPGNQKVRS